MFQLKKLSIPAGPLVFILTLWWAQTAPAETKTALCTAAAALWMAIWWLTEALPLGITSLLPVVLFPVLGIMTGKETSSLYFNEIIFLFMGGFLVAIAMQRWHLHNRLALLILRVFGLRPAGLLLGFMVATAFLSMWISNTATAMMMLPIALAIIEHFEQVLGKERIRRFGIGICLGIAYSASIGGIATLVGTPPNLAFVKIFSLSFPAAPEINFAQWMIFALPLTVFLLLVVWGFLSLVYLSKLGDVNLEEGFIQAEAEKLGEITYEERMVFYHFVLLALLWVTRTDLQIGSFLWKGWADFFFSNPEAGIQGAHWVKDGAVSVALGISLFLFPSQRSESGKIMDWEAAQKIPWQIILLFGGGFALAQGFKVSGLSALLGEQLSGLSALPIFWLVLIIALVMTFLTELTSNTATAQTLLPILAALAIRLEVNPLLLMVPATLSASFAFMLPVATPPNAIVFSSNRLKIADMAKAGLFLNLFGAGLVAIYLFLWGNRVFENLLTFPAWIN